MGLTVSIALRIATRTSATSKRVRKVDGVLHDVDLVLERRRDVDGGIGDDQGLVVARHVHDEAMADAPGRADAGLARHDGAHQFVGVQAALHQGLRPGRRAPARRPWPRNRGCARRRPARRLPMSSTLRAATSRMRAGGPTRIGREQAAGARLRPRLRARPRRTDGRPPCRSAGCLPATSIRRSYFSCRVAARARRQAWLGGLRRPAGGQRRTALDPLQPAAAFVGQGRRAPRTSLHGHPAPSARCCASSDSKPGNGAKRALFVEPQQQVLLAEHGLESRRGCAGDWPAAGGGSACRTAKPRSSTVRSRQADMQMRADHRLGQAAHLEALLQLGSRLRRDASRARSRSMRRLRRRLGAPMPDHRLQDRRAVGCRGTSPRSWRRARADSLPAGRDPGRGHLLHGEQRIVGRHRLAVVAHRRRPAPSPAASSGLRSEKAAKRSRLGCSCAHRFGRSGRSTMARTRRLGEGAVEAVIDLGQRAPRRRSAGRRPRSLPPSARMSSSVRASSRNRYLPSISSGLAVSLVDLGDHRLVEAGRHQVDHVHARGELGVLLGRHLAGHEDAEVADRLVQRVDDGLAVRDDLVLVLVEVGDPAQRLLRRRDVVAPRAEHDDRRADVAQVDAHAARTCGSRPT